MEQSKIKYYQYSTVRQKPRGFIFRGLNTTNYILLTAATLLLSTYCLLPTSAEAASLSVSPSGGTYTVGSTFDASIFLNSEGQSINAIQASLKFQPDKLQLISPGAGHSIIEVWTSQPKFDNQNGTVELTGVIPKGITTSQGLVARVTFRVKAVGAATLKFLDTTRVLLNDGSGTDVLSRVDSAVYQLVLPPPAGPDVVSETHPDQTKWYANPNVVLRWAPEDGVQGYGYILDENPVTTPGDISSGGQNSALYKNVTDGRHYFHIKALRSGSWGGVTHFAVNVDTAPPAEFPVEIEPSSRTARTIPIINFNTTDGASGIELYEIKVLSLNPAKAIDAKNEQSQNLFIETTSPYIPTLTLGDYDVIVRAYDKAGNYREATQRLSIVNSVFEFVGSDGLRIKGLFTVSWIWIWILGGLSIVTLGYVAWLVRRWHKLTYLRRLAKELPSDVKSRLDELNKYREKYGKIVPMILVMFTALLWISVARADNAEISPPLVTTVSKNISNEEIFYVGGKTDAPNTEVTLYIQSLANGETFSKTIASDKIGDWFYRHDTFLASGEYRLWAQSKIGEESSPPSPQIGLSVHPTALQFGATRVSYETLYLVIIMLLLLIISVFVAYIIYHAYHGRKKSGLLAGEIKEAEESIRRGFAVLRRDIEAELAVIHKIKLERGLAVEEKTKEEHLLKDLKSIERHLSKEIWDIERNAGSSM